jgi:phosphopantothenoylcysteine decarboxylase
MANILLGVTGSVAAIKVPEVFHAIRDRGHSVRVVATKAALYFFDAASLTNGVRDPEVVVIDDDEWPDRSEGRRFLRGEAVKHIELRRWADLYVIAPLDANTLAKLCAGICDNCLTCVWRAWEPRRPVLLAPAMNTFMWQHPTTRRHLRALASDFGADLPSHLDEAGLIEMINTRVQGLRISPPQSKELACGDIGIGAMANVTEIVADVEAMLVPDVARS